MSRDPLLDLFNGKSSERSERFDPKDLPAPVARAVIGNDRMELLNELPSKSYLLRDQDVQCYTIGSVAKVLGKSPVTIRSWEQKGWMALPKVRTSPIKNPSLSEKGRRLYTRKQVEYLIWAYDNCHLDDVKKADWDGFRQLLRNYPTAT